MANADHPTTGSVTVLTCSYCGRPVRDGDLDWLGARPYHISCTYPPASTAVGGGAPETTDAPIDEIARAIAAAIWRPQPHMSGDIWRRLGAHQRRHAEDAAREAFAIMRQWEAGK